MGILGQIDPSALLTVGVPAFAALVAAWLTYAVGRKRAASDAALAVTQGFRLLVKQLQEERVELIKVVDRQTDIMETQSSKITALEDEIRRQRRQLDRLEKALRDGGLDVPPEPNK